MRARIFILAAAAAAVLVSCGKETVEKAGGRAQESESIDFMTPLTRGTAIIDPAGIASAGGFCVWAYSHTGIWASASDKDLIINGQVTGSTPDGGVTWDWDYGPTQYWPDGKRVSFFAYEPYGKATPIAADAAGVPRIYYEVPGNIAAQTDLMIAEQVYNRMGSKPVDEMFYHATSRIRFSALKSSALTGVVKITAIEIKNLYYNGTASLLTPISWAVNPPADAEYAATVANGSLQNLTLTTSAQDMLAAGQALFLMPQTLDAAAEIVVTFTVDDLELSWSASIPSPAAWGAGKSYNYQLLIDGNLELIICGQLEAPGTGTWGDY